MKILKYIMSINLLTTAIFMMLGVGLILSSCDDEEGSSGEVVLQSFGPSPVMRGGELRFIGQNLDRVTAIVLPGSGEVTSFTTHTSALIVIQVPDATVEGKLTLKTSQGEIVTKTDLGIAEPITISSISPGTVRPGDLITIEGTYLNLVEEVVFSNSKSATEFESQSQTTLVVRVPDNAQSGTIALLDGEEIPNKINSQNQLAVVLPLVTAISPDPVKAGTLLTLTGTDLDLATTVTFAGGARVDSADFSSQTATQITLNAPMNAQAGTLEVTAASKVNTQSAVDVVLVVPTITAISPNPAKPGGTVTVTGTDLDLISGVSFNGTSGNLQGGTATSITIGVPQTATNGKVTFSTQANQWIESEDVVTMVVPTIAAFTPTTVETEAAPSITITGTNLDLVSKVIFEGGYEQTVNAATATELTIPVTPGSVSGKFKLVTINGAEVMSAAPLSIVPFVPEITSVPADGFIGSMITLTGTNMDIPADIILPGNVVATRFGVKTEATIEVFVPDNVAPGMGKVKFITFNNEIYESPAINFKFAGVEPVVDVALMINDFENATDNHNLDWDNWGGNGELGEDEAIKISGRYFHGKNSSVGGWQWIWGCNHGQMSKPTVTAADHLLKIDIKITKPIPADVNFQMELGGNRIDLGNLGGSTPNGGWITITYDLADFSLPVTLDGSGEWGMNQSSGTSDLTGLYMDNFRLQAK
jgi:hypothetical protein